MLPGFAPRRFRDARILKLLPGFLTDSKFSSFVIALRSLKEYHEFEVALRNFKRCQGFGVTTGVLELLPGYWSYSQGFGVTLRVLKSLPGF